MIEKKSGLYAVIIATVMFIINFCIYTKIAHLAKWLNLRLILINILAIISIYVFYVLDKSKHMKSVFLGLFVVFFLSTIYGICALCGIEHIFKNIGAMQDFIESTGAWGMIVFVLIQFLQATFIPIPAMITTIAGSILFGPTLAMILSLIGIFAASYFSFFLGRIFGEKVISWIIGHEDFEKYSTMLYDKGKYTFFLMQIFPFFPDDILCLVAGTTKMSLKFFTITMLIARPIAIIPTCYLGSGTIIPYSGWGLIVWGILILLMVGLFIISIKYQKNIENFVVKLSQKFTKNKNKKD